jgi:hypothetical protein
MFKACVKVRRLCGAELQITIRRVELFLADWLRGVVDFADKAN